MFLRYRSAVTHALLCEGNHTATRVVRNLSAKEVAFTRLLMHLAGVIGAASAPREWENKARAMLSPGQAKPQTARPWQPWLCAGNVLTLPIFCTYAEYTQSGWILDCTMLCIKQMMGAVGGG